VQYYLLEVVTQGLTSKLWVACSSQAGRINHLHISTSVILLSEVAKAKEQGDKSAVSIVTQRVTVAPAGKSHVNPTPGG
jgi:hypothetical protein